MKAGAIRGFNKLKEYVDLSVEGTLDASYHELYRALGPQLPSNRLGANVGGKVATAWVLADVRDPTRIAVIRDWKQTSAYSRSLPTVETWRKDQRQHGWQVCGDRDLIAHLCNCISCVLARKVELRMVPLSEPAQHETLPRVAVVASDEVTAQVAEIHVFPKHGPKACDCGTAIDTCCGPAQCPRCGRPTKEAMNS